MNRQLYHTTDNRGVSELCPDKPRMRKIIQTLDEGEAAELDHPDISLVHDESGWSISLYPGGIATFENLDEEDRVPRFLKNVSREQAFSLWSQLAEGRIKALQQLNWRKP